MPFGEVNLFRNDRGSLGARAAYLRTSSLLFIAPPGVARRQGPPTQAYSQQFISRKSPVRESISSSTSQQRCTPSTATYS